MHFESVILQPKTKQKKHRKMKNTNPIFSLKNFRSFGEEGADFELAPITVLTGCNSAGKSSLVKALLLLSVNKDEVKGGATWRKDISEKSNPDIGEKFHDISVYSQEFNYPSIILKVSAKELGLGRFDKVLHRNAKDGMLKLSYRMWSRYLREEVVVTRLFRANSNDILNNGELIEFTIKQLNGTILYRYFLKDSIAKHPKNKMGSFFEETLGWNLEYNFDMISEQYNKYCDIRRYYDWQGFIQLSQYIVPESESGSLQRIRKMIEDNPHLIEDYSKHMEELKKRFGEEVEDYRDIIPGGLPNSDSVDEWTFHTLMRRIEGDLTDFKNNIIAPEMIGKIYIDVVNDCITPRFIVNNTYIDSSSAIVQRLYSLEDENKLSVALGKVIKRGVILNTLSKNGFIETGDFVNKWLGEFKIADKIRIEGTEEGIGIKVFIVKGKEKRLLADEGYGITQLASLFIQIENNIIENTRVRYEKVHTGISSYIKDSCHYQPSYITIEEPENHLHPKYQSLLADMFVEAYQVYNIHFIIETHSEYLIRKLQVLVADKENELTPNDVSLNYVEKDDGGISHNRQIKIQEDGRLSEPFGPGFFDESKTLVMQMLKF